MTFHERLGFHLYNLLRPVLQLLSRRMSERVRVIVINDNKEILLVRNWFSRQHWSLPGGGIGAGEPIASAAVREVREETGVSIRIPDLKDLGTTPYPAETIKYQLHGFIAAANGTPKLHGIHRLEILEVKWCPIDKLPKNRSPIIEEFLRRAGHLSA
jgi:8-oxo-dGTP pyrophosphatase MutT (NUDIX family)